MMPPAEQTALLLRALRPNHGSRIMADSTSAVRWGDGRRADSDYAREQILDAACRCYAANTISKTTMEHIAREAKISRATIYRHFDNRDEVLTGVLVRAIAAITGELRDSVAHIENFGEFLIRSQVLLIERAPQVPLFAMFLAEQSALLNRLCIGSSDINALVAAYFQQRFERAQAAGEIRAGVELGPLVDWILHISSAYLLAPTTLRGSGLTWRETLRRFLAPAILSDAALARLQ